MSKTILVLGSGVTATMIVQSLRDLPGLRCLLGARDPVRGAARARSLEVEFTPLDISRASTLHAALQDVHFVAHAAGPFVWQDRAVAAACARRGVHYLDLADIPSYVNGMKELDTRAREGGACILSGAGISPALSGALALELAQNFDEIQSIDIGLYLQGARSPAAWQTLLSGIGLPLPGQPQRLAGADEGALLFGPPLGPTPAYAWDSVDTQVFADRFPGARIRSRQATDPGLRRLLRWGSWLRRKGMLNAPERQLRSLAVRLAQPLPPRSVLHLEMEGVGRGRPQRRQLEISAEQDIALLATAPLLAIVRRWLEQGPDSPGARSAMGAASLTEIAAVLSGRGVRLSSAPAGAQA
ncbi:MAG TPA: saccharopine dehydrogenase NADP-binding domain-containing protein [Acidiferrobacteraceae bacterium]|nr:saccharopine dehydrogenase NADP-binding domain-containing protein [Acidiferrobacteraceae bacterium]